MFTPNNTIEKFWTLKRSPIMFHTIALITIVATQFEMNEMEEHTTDSFQILL